MRVFAILLVMMWCKGTLGQTTEKRIPKSFKLLEDGWYKAWQLCYNEDFFATENIKRYRWVKVEDNIVVALRFGGDLSVNPDNLLNNPNLLKVPFIEDVNGKMMAFYTISNQPTDSDFSSTRNTMCRLEIVIE